MVKVLNLSGIQSREVLFVLSNMVKEEKTPSRKGAEVNMFGIFSNIAMVLGTAIGLYTLSSYDSN